MWDLSINAGYLQYIRKSEAKRSIGESIRMCSEAGFRFVDLLPNATMPDWQDQLREMKEATERYGVKIHQGHIPMNRYTRHPADEFHAVKMHSVEAAAALGIEHLVLHADEYITPESGYDPDAALKSQYEDLAPVVEYAKKYGVGIAIENVFEDHFKAVVPGGRTRFTSEIDELLAIIEKFNDPIVSCCWDFGHGHVQFEENDLEMLRKVGKYLTCTHVHDSAFHYDTHLPIYFGNVDWEKAVKILQEIGYKGKFTYEFVYGRIPEELLPTYLKVAYQTAEYLISKK